MILAAIAAPLRATDAAPAGSAAPEQGLEELARVSSNAKLPASPGPAWPAPRNSKPAPKSGGGRNSSPARGPLPSWSYAARFCGSCRTSYASPTSLKRASASFSLLTSG
jgi:hypothetical protein